jgi:adenine-specific DNA-methyltransferase
LCPNQKQFERIDGEEAEKVIELAKIDEEKAIQISNNLISRIIV